jgi:flagellar basal-body rod protein FlgB
MKIFDDTLARLERSLDVRLTRHGVLAGNVANVDTPGYRPKDVDFAAEMDAAAARPIEQTHARHLDATGALGQAGGVRVVETAGAAPGLDGNEVDLDKTMTAMAENAIQYQANARAASKKLALLKYVASDGNG